MVTASENRLESVPFLGGWAQVCSARSPEASGPNEDAALIMACSETEGVLAVADGVGGGPFGELASKTIVEQLAATVAGDPKQARGRVRTGVLDAIESSNRKLRGLGAATTVTVLEVNRDAVRPYQVGDSMVLVVGQRGKVKYQSVAHGPVGYGVEAGLIDEAAAMAHADRHIVNNIVGAVDMRIEIGPRIAMTPRSTVILGSDGLFDNLYLEEIIDIVRVGPIEHAANTLVQCCRERMCEPCVGKPSKPDDCTFILYRPR